MLVSHLTCTASKSSLDMDRMVSILSPSISFIVWFEINVLFVFEVSQTIFEKAAYPYPLLVISDVVSQKTQESKYAVVHICQNENFFVIDVVSYEQKQRIQFKCLGFAFELSCSKPLTVHASCFILRKIKMPEFSALTNGTVYRFSPFMRNVVSPISRSAEDSSLLDNDTSFSNHNCTSHGFEG